MKLTSLASTPASLDVLATHCIEARAMIEQSGTPMMRRLIDLLLFEIGVALAGPSDAEPAALQPAE
jgi:hypothetical protein